MFLNPGEGARLSNIFACDWCGCTVDVEMVKCSSKECEKKVCADCIEVAVENSWISFEDNYYCSDSCL